MHASYLDGVPENLRNEQNERVYIIMEGWGVREDKQYKGAK